MVNRENKQVKEKADEISQVECLINERLKE